MSTITAGFSTVGAKLQAGAAASVIVAAAVLSPAAVAYADPAAPVPMAGLGSSISLNCDQVVSPGCDAKGLPAPSSPSAGRQGVAAAIPGGHNVTTASPTGPFQNEFVWVGPIPDPVPDPIFLVQFNVINALPQLLRAPLQGWFEQVIPNGFQACVAGLTGRVDKYGTFSVGLTRGCS